MKNVKEQIANHYMKISATEGSEFIASEYAIYKIHELINVFNRNNILEVGLGIGSISETILSLNKDNAELKYDGTEANKYCLSALTLNLKKDNFGRLGIYRNIADLPEENKYDLVIIDGKDEHLSKLKKQISKNAIIVIEGDRMPQQKVLQELFSGSKFYHSICLEKNKDYSPYSTYLWQAGIKVIFVNPSFKQILWRLKEKISTKIKYLFPNRHRAKQPLEK